MKIEPGMAAVVTGGASGLGKAVLKALSNIEPLEQDGILTRKTAVRRRPQSRLPCPAAWPKRLVCWLR